MVAEYDGDLDAARAYNERALAVRQAIERMSDRDRLMVILYYQDDASIDEIAGILGCRAGAVKVALHRARARLREQLERAGFGG